MGAFRYIIVIFGDPVTYKQWPSNHFELESDSLLRVVYAFVLPHSTWICAQYRGQSDCAEFLFIAKAAEFSASSFSRWGNRIYFNMDYLETDYLLEFALPVPVPLTYIYMPIDFDLFWKQFQPRDRYEPNNCVSERF